MPREWTAKKWTGGKTCDFCKESVETTKPYFVDGKTTRGPWALMCHPCFRRNGIGLGCGKGRAYHPATFEEVLVP